MVSDSAPRVLMVVDKSPWPATTGSRVRLSELWGAFDSGRRHLVVLGDPEPGEASALDHAAAGSYSVVSGRMGFATHDRLSAELQDADVLWASGPGTASALGALGGIGGIGRPTIVDAPSLNSRLLLNELAVRLRGLPSPRDAKRLLTEAVGAPERLRSERNAWARASVITPCSPYEQRRLPRPVRARSVLVPNGCELRPLRSEPQGSPRLIFVGTLHYPPNAEAALILAERVIPSVRRVVPGLELDIVGSLPEHLGARLSRADGITVHGFVGDLTPLYRAATHSVIPLRRSTGTNIKVLESIAHGLPVIASPAALSGLPALVPGRDVVEAPDWRECGRLLLELIGEPESSRALAASAWRTVERHYTWERSRDTLRRIVERLTVSSSG